MRYNGKTDSSTISARVRELGFERYADYLRSPHWQEVRRRFYAKHPQRCACGAKAVALHHLTYERLGAEWLEDLEAVCDRCHRARHRVPTRAPTKLKTQPSKKQLKRKRYKERRRRRKNPVAEVKPSSSKGYRRGEVKDGPSKLTFHP